MIKSIAGVILGVALIAVPAGIKEVSKEKQALEEALAAPEKIRELKLFPRSQWEILKPTKMDVIGFGGSWVLVGVIIFLLWLMVSIK